MSDYRHAEDIAEDLWWESSHEIFLAEQRRQAVAQSRRTRFLLADFEPRIFSESEDQERSY